ncbi:UDP-glucose 4-epimerase [Ferrigenium kumadai]|uniref:UDP-glucose 4-epimerase n=1 Tax=Ferrigenium kumadai TaxID=1682490 RepID=A0AAN1T0S6_9PROT|nr:SDR family oxidoreductase [Ferrigenium kumadai]BBJ00633.1 UDP-glucose 4-epimerase [Ferrigenium kumadai]
MSENRPKVLVTGANGFVGRVVCEELRAGGYFVRVAVRSQSHYPGIEIVHVGTVDGHTDWREAVRGIDVVIHLAARVHVMHDEAADPLEEFRKVNTTGTEQLARTAVALGVRRFVYVSSIKVNGEVTHGEERFTERDVPAPQDPYGVSKWEAEQALHRVAEETGLEVVIVRPPLVYGEAVKGNFAQMMRVVARGLPLPFASVRNRRDLIYVGNLADALVACAVQPEAKGQTYLVSDGESISTPDLLRLLGSLMGVKSRVFHCPPTWLRLAGMLVGKSAQIERLLGSLQVDSGKICRELNWKPPYTLQQGLHKTIAATLDK